MSSNIPEAAVQQAILSQTEAALTSAASPASPSQQDASLQEIDLVTPDATEDELPPPAYSTTHGEMRNEKAANGQITDDGRVNIRVNHLNQQLSQILIPALRQQTQRAEDSQPPPPPYVPSSLGGDEGKPLPPPLNIVIQVVGSRGDVQPFVALGTVLKNTYGHRVRIATHPVFRDFVLAQELEFFSIGGDPERLMAFMVKNPGLRPGFRSVVSGDVGERRKDVAEYIQGCWRSCYKADDGGQNTTESTSKQHFVADCIIANPPSFAHIHCAEKLGIPLHIMFTMPYSPTQAFPHPLANIQSSSADPHIANYISYGMIELLSWEALGDIINRFRVKCLGLDRLSTIWAPGMLQRLKIPHTYCWSPALIPKPKDWDSHITISGFSFLKLASDYTPAPDLQEFLDKGPPPIYIGFGSIVLDNPNTMTKLIFEAVKKIGQRVLLSKGWGGMGTDELSVPDGVFMLGNVPHDWLFTRVSCVVHHGGAGTTAAGIAAGRPTFVVPFFGDQHFWGAMVARAGAGPTPVPHKLLSAEKLTDAINFCLKPESLKRAKDFASKIGAEKGSDKAAQSIHQFLEPDRLRCTLAPSRAAAWRIKGTTVRLSAFAACTLASSKLLDFQDLKLFRPQEHYTDEGPWDPLSGSFTAFLSAVGGMTMGLADIPSETWRALKLPTERRSSQQTQKSGLGSISRKESSDGSAASGKPERASGSDTPTSAMASSSTPNLTYKQISQNGSSSSTDPDMMRPTGVHMTRGAGRFAKALVQGPVDISVNITRGFHNIPKLWGDDTVRPQERVTDFKSGTRAVGREFGFGFYDAFTGVVTQPWRGAQKDGAGGFVKGVGKGLGGLVIKPGAAMMGILGYTMQGVSKEVQKLFGGNVHSYIVASRAAQGYEDWLRSGQEEREDVVARWKLVQKFLKKRHTSGEIMEHVLADQRKASLGDRSTLRARESTRTANSIDTDGVPPQEESAMTADDVSEADVSEFIRQSAQETSRRDIQTQEYEEQLARAMAQSLREQRRPNSDSGWASGIYLDDEHGVERQRAAAVSEKTYAVVSNQREHIEDITTSEFEAQRRQTEKTMQENTEEAIVMEYIKNQSLLEAQHRSRGKLPETAMKNEEGEELQRVLKLSMRDGSSGGGEGSGG